MNDSRLHLKDNSSQENVSDATADTVDNSENQAPTQNESDEAQREEERQLETGEENPT